MSLSGTRGLVRISINPRCELQASMVVERVREPDFYRRLTAEEYPGEYGERQSARRRGNKFEQNLYANNAALLRAALGPAYGWNPDDMTVRNFAEELPGARDGIRGQRLYRTRLIIRDLRAARPVPPLLIQPQLQLRTGGDLRRSMFVSPDFMVLDSRAEIYVPGELKSFIIRDGVAEPRDLDRTRRQAAAQILALREEASRVGLEAAVSNRAVFVFATPYGLIPAPPVEEKLDGAVREIASAISVLEEAARGLQGRKAVDGASLVMMADDIPINFQDSCFGSCILAARCKQRYQKTTRTLGDAAVELFGQVAIERIAALLDGASPETQRESEMLPRLREAQNVIRRIA
jgi:hypothetical protein